MTADKKIEYLLNLITNSQEKEEWREIKGTQGDYFISSNGRVLSLCNRNPRILKPFLCGSGYQYVSIQQKDYRVNRLVGIYFVDNKENKPIIHHKDNNKLNNNVSNLEWVTAKEHANKHRKKQWNE